MERIETKRLILRPFVESDAADASYNSKTPIVSHFMSDMVLESEAAALGWIRWLNNEKFSTDIPCVVLAIELKLNGKCIGLIGVAPKRELGGEIEILFSIADEYHSSGYATEAGKAMIWWAFVKAGQEVLSAIVKPENKASRRVIEKLGFVFGDTRILPYDGHDCEFDYFRLYCTDDLPGPEWDIHSLYRPEPMGAFFDARSDIYNDKMLSGSGLEDYKKLGACFPKTDRALNILDIGCGTGIELDYIWEQAPNAHIACVDVSRGMLDLLLDDHPGSHDKITIIEASYIDWAYPQSAYDIVVSNMTMHHLWPDEKVGVYRKIRNAIKPGGCYMEGDFMVDALAVKQYRQRYEIITANLPDKAAPGEYHIDIPCSVETQMELLRNAGFGSVEILCEDINRGNGAILLARK
ncbi:MAG: bifunctional GNAT family N-acetyltransferase/class I SAM-dependent methyltransferase [Oscillospiraceae bacterium]|nr:bifunctional GNAT family N-acetyltransferase/class I SAM-dependent methyltransferase [Oscillospiraceae bacterium]